MKILVDGYVFLNFVSIFMDIGYITDISTIYANILILGCCGSCVAGEEVRDFGCVGKVKKKKLATTILDEYCKNFLRNNNNNTNNCLT